MQSTFHGLETARRAMMTQQYALRTVGHNVANANTPGYSRQRVNFSQTEPYPSIGMNSPRIPGHLGTGVKAGSVQRIREQFLDVQYRNESNKVGYWDARYGAFEKMEDILMETKDQGLNYQINLFWTSLQDLILDPEDSGARSVVRERGKFIAETFNHYHNSLTEIKNDYAKEIEDTEKQMNIILESIEQINDQIRRTEPHGYVPNDLYDRQDQLLDQLSQIVNIKVTREQSGGKPSDVAEGAVTVTLVNDLGEPYKYPSTDEEGNPIQLDVKLIDGKGNQDPLKANIAFNDKGFVEGFTFSNVSEDNPNNPNPITVDNIGLDKMPRGELKALIEAYGYTTGKDEEGNDIIVGLYPDMIKELNLVAEKFAEEFNNIHKLGFTLPNKDGEVTNGGNFFDLSGGGDAALNIKVHEDIVKSLNNIAASGVNKDALSNEGVYTTVDGVDYSARGYYEHLMAKTPKEDADYKALHNLLQDKDPAGTDSNPSNFIDGVDKSFAGDASNAKLLANMKDTLLSFGDDTASVSSYYQGVIGDMAVSAQEAFGMLGSSLSIRDTVEYNRQGISGVSLDEEFTLLIQFQHAYNAAARNITTIDEMLDRIINGMGVVGR